MNATTRFTRKALTAAALATLLMPLAPAQPGEGGPGGDGPRREFNPERFLERMDANKDGKIQRDEFRGPAERFDAADTDKDGVLSKEELAAGFENFRRGRGGEGRGGFGNMVERLKEDLQVTDEEWTVLEPRVRKVVDLQRQGSPLGGGFRGGRGGGQGGPGGPGGAGFVQPLPQQGELRDALSKQDTSSDEIKAKVEALRKARAKNDEELKAARTELRELLTPRQEAELIVRGILD